MNETTDYDIVQIQSAAERARDGYRHEEAIALYTQCLDLLQTSGMGDPALEYDLLDGRAGEYRYLGDFLAAIADFEAATTAAEKLGDLSRLAMALNNQANLSVGTIGPTEGERLVERALDIARDANDIRQVAYSHRVRASISNRKGSQPKALEEHQQALNLYRQVGDLAGEARSLSSMILVNVFLGISDSTAEYGKDALVIARQIEDREIEAWTLNYLGSSQRNSAEQRSMYEQALSLFQFIDDRRGKSFAANNLSMLSYRLGMYRRGLAYAKLQIADLQDHMTVKLYHADLIGLNALGLMMFDEAESAWLEGLQTANKLGAGGELSMRSI
jgi:tetratricopeptide (TPR) repeat protein